MSLWQHYDKVITRMQADICRLIEEKAEIEACVEDLIAIRDQARAVHATGAACYNDTRTSVDRDITNRNLLARFEAAIIGWSCGRGMPNIKIEYPKSKEKSDE